MRQFCLTFTNVYYGHENVFNSKQKPSIIHYHKFKDFNNDSFIKDLQILLTKFFNGEAIPFQTLKKSVNVTLEKHAPYEQKIT